MRKRGTHVTSILIGLVVVLVTVGLVVALVFALPRLSRSRSGKVHTDDPAALRHREIDVLKRAMQDVVNDARAQGKSDAEIEQLKAGYQAEIDRLTQEGAEEGKQP